jgi:hypothetical protein
MPLASPPVAPATPAHGRSRRHRVARAALLLAFFLLCLHGALWDSPSADEFTHVPSGYFYWRTGNFALYAQSPPLIKLIESAPLLLLRPDLDLAPRIRNDGWYPFVYGTDFMERNRARYDELFFWCRLPVVLLGLLGAWLCYLWSRRLYGNRAALVTLALYCFCPTLIGHAHMATVDVGHAAFFIATLYSFWRYLERPGPARLLLVGAALGLALASKFTAILLLPILLAVAAVDHWRRPRLRLATMAGALAAIAVVGVAMVDLIYLGQGVGHRLGGLALHSDSLSRVLRLLPQATPSPVPLPFLFGLDGILLINQLGENPSYLLGHWSMHGFPGYYLYAILFKSPLPFLAALVALPFARSGDRRADHAVTLPLAIVFVVFTLFSRANFGIRYILPLLPLACVAAGRLVPWLATRGRLAAGAGLVLLGIYPVSAIVTSPDSVAYFNLLARGRGDRLLLDSNLDWGQGLKRLRAFMERRGLASIDLAYFGHVDPAIYGIRWQFPEPGRKSRFVVVSANFAHGYPYVTYADGGMVPVPEDAYAWTAGLPFERNLGGGLLLFRGDAP